MTKLHELLALGQSVWFDFIRRSFTRDGRLQALIDQGIRGVTSNPSIFEKAIAGSEDYDADIRRLAGDGKSVLEIYEALVVDDIREAADALRPTYDESDGRDGFVSLEVSPTLAHDTAGTVLHARRLAVAVDRPNLMIKIPATTEGIAAIERVIGDGICVNATLIFSLEQYEATAAAYRAGLERLRASGRPLGRTASVASFFVSRIDTAVDDALAGIGRSELRGHAAVDNARLAYESFRKAFADERWQGLARAGARVQRPLWASTGTKSAAYPDTLYVDSLIGADTVNTVPPATLQAFIDHGRAEPTVGNDMEAARARRAGLSRLGIDLDAIAARLLADGVGAFAAAFQGVLESIEKKAVSVSQGRTEHGARIR
jgi:transaldolase